MSTFFEFYYLLGRQSTGLIADDTLPHISNKNKNDALEHTLNQSTEFLRSKKLNVSKSEIKIILSKYKLSK